MASQQDNEQGIHQERPKIPKDIYDPRTLEIAILRDFARLEEELQAAGVLLIDDSTDAQSRRGDHRKTQFSSHSFSRANLERVSQIDRVFALAEEMDNKAVYNVGDTWTRETQAYNGGIMVSEVAPTWQDEMPSLRVGLFYGNYDSRERYNFATEKIELLEPYETLQVNEHGENGFVIRRVDITFLKDGSTIVNFYGPKRPLGERDLAHGFFPDGTRMTVNQLQNAEKRIHHND